MSPRILAAMMLVAASTLAGAIIYSIALLFCLHPAWGCTGCVVVVLASRGAHKAFGA